ncbi:DUF2489 domain-containing protein [Cognaticolwellia beringensis]|uniref:DUF2489 domain-containing protein n=1 Tax=Cognaticolwellia beringensis TaxID=1967665 RepID=A0A222G6Y4_9GAMM|nr:DUF2489 domain-containing protein [Cognaticolwellia beringensis]ASP47560.1 DUF2489 domain-containing protein [Cognaticolwellia beringensis]
MLLNPWIYLALLALVIIGVLAAIATKLLRQLKQQTLEQEQQKAAQQQALQQHDKKIISSVVIIVRAMKEEQCDIAEGCWRLSVLLDSLKLSQDLHVQFPAIFKFYEAIKHMPILAARKKLDKKSRMKLDFERMKLEAEMADDIRKDIELLHQYANERNSMLSAASA